MEMVIKFILGNVLWAILALALLGGLMWLGGVRIKIRRAFEDIERLKEKNRKLRNDFENLKNKVKNI